MVFVFASGKLNHCFHSLIDYKKGIHISVALQRLAAQCRHITDMFNAQPWCKTSFKYVVLHSSNHLLVYSVFSLLSF
jgi:hypothetical protein